jgi:hypothetical protein
MDAHTYLKISAINLSFLMAGMWIGSQLFSGRRSTMVHAQQQFEDITPGVSTGTMAVGTFLAGRIATDQLMVQGIDILKLNENLLNLLARKPMVATQLELQGVIDKSRVEKILRMKPPDQPKPRETPKGVENK